MDFIWRNVVCRYGIPYTLINNKYKHFNNHSFRKFCKNLIIKLKFCLPVHPKAYGQVEVMNKTIKRLVKTRLGEKKERRLMNFLVCSGLTELPKRLPQEKTPFVLAFGHKVIIPVELGMGTHQT